MEDSIDPEMKSTVFPVLLAGGSGTRLWPVSRELYPKQLVKFIGEDSLVQSTIKRLQPLLEPDNIRIVCGLEHLHETARHMEEIGLDPDGKIVCEPCGRNTAPAILLALLTIQNTGQDPLVCVFPADHVIENIAGFHEKLLAAIRLAETGKIVTFGIQPHYPETGYGYIEGGEALPYGGYILQRFVEKPDREKAQIYLDAGNFFWNSGMFAFRSSVMVNEFKRNEPEMVHILQNALESGKPLTLDVYRQLRSISIDYAIMEKTDLGAVLPSDFGWSDIGSWKALYDFLPKDEQGNVIDGDVISKGTTDCFILGHDRLIATNHLERLVVVETPDSIFVSDLENSRDVKSIVESLKSEGRREYQHHRTRYYPWGRETLLEQRKGYRVRRLVLYPDGTRDLSLEKGMMLQGIIVSGECFFEGSAEGMVQRLQNGDSYRIEARNAAFINESSQNTVLIETEIPVDR
jgi:mannose-1-phosphate guanylyltransferase/mannose-6-phosphate isomerase